MTEAVRMYECICGCVFSEKVMILRDSDTCPKCGSFERSKWKQWVEAV